jgi:MSHA biogenesis protein MshK
MVFTLEAFAGELRDPTLPLIAEQEKEQSKEGKDELVLTGIVIFEKQKRAILNNKIFKEGDKIQGMEITRIEKDKVIFKNGQEEKIISLFRSSVKGEGK